MTSEHDEAAAEAANRSLIERRARAVHDRDVESATSNHAPDVVLFDAEEPLPGGDGRHRE